MRRGFLCLVAIMAWFTRKVLAWRISNTLAADFCLKALNEAIHKFGPAEIMNMEPGRASGSSGQARSAQPVHVPGPDRPAEAGQRPKSAWTATPDAGTALGHSPGPMAFIPATCRASGDP